MSEDKLNPHYNDLIGNILKEYTKSGGTWKTFIIRVFCWYTFLHIQ